MRMLYAACLFALCFPSAAGIRVQDAAGISVELSVPAQRIVTLSPHAAELVYAAGAGDRLVGVSAYSDYPEPVSAVPVIGDAYRADTEAILSLKPDLVVGWESGNPVAGIATLKRLGLPVFLSEPASLDDVADEIDAIGRLAGTAAAASAASEAYRDRLRELRAHYRGRMRLRTLYLLSPWPPMTVSATHIISEAMRLCGGDSIFPEIELPAARVGIEAIIQRRPQVMIIGLSAGHDIAQIREDWAGTGAIPAVRHQLMFGIDANLLHRPTPRILDGVSLMCEDLQTARRQLSTKTSDE